MKLKICENLRTTSLNSKFDGIGFYENKKIISWIFFNDRNFFLKKIVLVCSKLNK